MNRELPIYYGDAKVGTCGISAQSEYYLVYASEWLQSGFPISVHLPLTRETYRGKAVEYFIENLLPEADIRHAIAQKHGVSSNNYFSLMLHIGRDCAGAFSLGAPQSTGVYDELSKQELEDLLMHLPQYPLASNRKGASFSLAGAQNKIPLFLQEGRYYLPVYGAASNCIIKTPILRVENSVVNELFCMSLARRALKHAAAVDYLSLPQLSALVVHRFDRIRCGAFLRRVPQEDFCQLSVLPSSMKYECDGGPGYRECVELIKSYSTLPAPDVILLIQWAVFNLCIGNMDAHAKNLSLCAINGKARLAPFYDLISTLRYPEFNADLAMRIGGRSNPQKIGRKQWEDFARDIQMPSPFVLKEVGTTIRKVINALPDTAAEILVLGGVDTYFIRELQQNTLRRCMNLLRLLQK